MESPQANKSQRGFPAAKSQRESPAPKRAKTSAKSPEEASGSESAKAACDAVSTLCLDIETARSASLTHGPVHTNQIRKVQADLATILEKVPELTQDSQPLTTETGSEISPFHIAEFYKQMKGRGSYRCAGNALWIALTTPTPEIRLSDIKTNELQEIMSKNPEMLTIKVRVDKDWSEKDLMSQIKAGLQMVVPVEPLHAFWGAFAAHVKNNNDEKIREFLRIALSMQIHMVHLDSEDDCSSESMNYRELLKEMGDLLRVTPLMRLIHFSHWKARYLKQQKKKLGAQALLEEYLRRNPGALGLRSEKLTTGWADMAQTIDNRMLIIPEVKEGLLEAEDFPSGTNPLEGISMLQFFC